MTKLTTGILAIFSILIISMATLSIVVIAQEVQKSEKIKVGYIINGTFYENISSPNLQVTSAVRDGITYENSAIGSQVFKYYFRVNSNTAKHVRYEKDGYFFIYDISDGQLLWAVQDGKPAATDTLGGGASSNSLDTIAILNSTALKYPYGYYKTNVTYVFDNDMLKETFILEGLPLIKDYTYLQYSGNVYFNRTLQICANNQCYKPSGTEDNFNTTGKIYFKDMQNKTIFYLKEPIINDSAGNSVRGYYVVRGSDAQMAFSIRIPTTFIQSAVFPIIIDPTIVSQIDKSVVFDIDGSNNLSYTLYKSINGQWENDVESIWVSYNEDTWKLGANDTDNNGTEYYKYLVKSDMPIIQDSISFKVGDYRLNFDDICNKENSSCEYNLINSTNLEVTFYSNWDIDPLIVLDENYVFTTGLNDNTYSQDNRTILKINATTTPYQYLGAYFPLDLNDSALAYDFSGLGNSKAYTGTTYKSDCMYGGCRYFNGLGDRIGGTSMPSLSKLKNWTATGWINMADNVTYNTFFANSISATNLIGIQYHSLGKVVVVGVYNGSAFGSYIYKAQGPSLNANQWYHLAVSFKDGNISIYLNGTDVTTTTVYTPLMQTTSGFVIGARTGDNSYAFNGSIDEVMIFNETLTQSQVLAIYNNQSDRFVPSGIYTLPSLNISSGFNIAYINLSSYQRLLGSNISLRLGQWDTSLGYNNSDFSGLSNLVSIWHFDNNSNFGESSTVAYDYSGHNYNGTISGAKWNSSGKYWGALDFDGINDKVTTTVPFNYSYSFSLWFKTNVTNAGYILGFNTTLVSPNVQILNNKVFVQQASDHYVYSATNVVDNKWYHLAVNYNYNCSNVDLYLNGVISESSLSAPYTPFSINAFTIGARGAGTGNFFNGSLDEIILFNSSLTSQEVKALYTGSPHYGGPVPLWNFTEFQNISSGTGTYPNLESNTPYNISSSTTNLLLNYKLWGGLSNFYTPILKATSGITLLYVETAFPDIQIVYPLNTSYNQSISSLNYTVYDSKLDSCWYSLNGGTNTSMTCGQNLTGLSSVEGSNRWTVYANDTSNNINSSSVSFYTDTIIPVINFTNYTETSGTTILVRGNIQINVTVVDTNLKNITIYLYNSTGFVNSSNSTTSPLFANFSNLSDGIYYFNATSYDALDNYNKTETRNVTLLSDITPPNVSIISPLNQTYSFTETSNSAPILINFSAEDNIAISKRWYYDGTNNITYTTPYQRYLSSGTYYWIFYANDTAGNLNQTNVTFIVNINVLGGGGGGGSFGDMINNTIICEQVYSFILLHLDSENNLNYTSEEMQNLTYTCKTKAGHQVTYAYVKMYLIEFESRCLNYSLPTPKVPVIHLEDEILCNNDWNKTILKIPMDWYIGCWWDGCGTPNPSATCENIQKSKWIFKHTIENGVWKLRGVRLYPFLILIEFTIAIILFFIMARIIAGFKKIGDNLNEKT